MSQCVAARLARALCVAGALAGVAAQAAIIVPGTYALSNHPDGAADPPPYGMRLDELYNETGGHDIFTMDFDDPASAMFLDYDGSSIHIYGQSWGGRDVGAVYAADAYLGLYTIDFTFNVGVGLVPGDDDLWTPVANLSNFGTIGTPLGVVPLADISNGTYTFRLGDEDNDLGHRGFSGISGWGWLAAGTPFTHVADMDFLFTAKLIPAPGAGAVLAIGCAAMLRRRRTN